MNVQGIWKFAVARQSILLVVTLLSLLVISLMWNVRQYQVIDDESAGTRSRRNDRKPPLMWLMQLLFRPSD